MASSAPTATAPTESIESSGGSGEDDAVDAGGGVDQEQPPAEEEYSDDDRPMPIVLRARNNLGSTSTTPAPAPAPAAAPAAPEPSAPPPPPSFSDDSSSVMRNVTVENSSAFDCSICYHPLKSPIFQCTVGHVVCSPCHDKLWEATNCHVCRIPIPDGYFRCTAMEHVVDSIRIPCPHAAHGCTERPAYHDRDNHARTCAHKPCHCPGEGCGFIGPLETKLLEHFATVHGWPCSTGTGGFDVSLRKGFNIVVVTVTATEFTTEQQYTLVLNVEEAAPVCNTITAFCIHPSNTGTIRLGLSYYRVWQGSCTSQQSSQLAPVECTDLSNGMPGPSSCFPPFLVPRGSAAPGGKEDDGDDIRIKVNIYGT